MGKRGRPRLTPAPLRYRATSYVRKGTDLRAPDRAYIRAAFALQPDLKATWWMVRHDGSLDRRWKRWFTRQQVGEWRGFVEDYVDRSLQR